jgi:hypothetical protein
MTRKKLSTLDPGSVFAPSGNPGARYLKIIAPAPNYLAAAWQDPNFIFALDLQTFGIATFIDCSVIQLERT